MAISNALKNYELSYENENENSSCHQTKRGPNKTLTNTQDP